MLLFFFNYLFILVFVLVWFGVVALQAGHGDSSHGHDGLPVSGAESNLESYDSLTINVGPLLLLGGTIYNKKREREREKKKFKEKEEVLILFSLSIEKLIAGSPRSMI